MTLVDLSSNVFSQISIGTQLRSLWGMDTQPLLQNLLSSGNGRPNGPQSVVKV
jgi:hypothetical protein